jgi:acyl-CoA thioesterase FadM
MSETAVTGETTATRDMAAAHLDRRTRNPTPWPPEIRAAAARLGGAEAPAAG